MNWCDTHDIKAIDTTWENIKEILPPVLDDDEYCRFLRADVGSLMHQRTFQKWYCRTGYDRRRSVAIALDDPESRAAANFPELRWNMCRMLNAIRRVDDEVETAQFLAHRPKGQDLPVAGERRHTYRSDHTRDTMRNFKDSPYVAATAAGAGTRPHVHEESGSASSGQLTTAAGAGNTTNGPNKLTRGMLKFDLAANGG